MIRFLALLVMVSFPAIASAKPFGVTYRRGGPSQATIDLRYRLACEAQYKAILKAQRKHIDKMERDAMIRDRLRYDELMRRRAYEAQNRR